MSGLRQRRKRRSNAACTSLAADDVLRADVPTSEGEDFIAQTVAVWQPLVKRPLTREDGRQIAENVAGFFQILQEWDRAERAAEAAKRRG